MRYQRADRHEVAPQSAGVFKELQILYDIRQLATEDLQIIYDIRQLAGKSLEFIYDIRQLAGKSLDIVYDMGQTAGKSLEIIYDILNEGVRLVGDHARALIPRGQQFIDLEYTFWIKSALLVDTTQSFRLFSSILRGIKNTFKVKSSILRPVETNCKVKSSLIKDTESSYRVKSSLLQPIIECKIGVKGNTISNPEYRNIDKKKAKKLLLLNLVGDILDD